MGALFRIDGVREIGQWLGGIASKMKDTRTARKFIGEEMLLRNHRRLSQGVDVDGRRFKPSRRVERDGGQTMWDRGVLAASLNYDLPADHLDLYSADKRALVHYLGLTIKPKKGQFLTIPLRARGGMFEGAKGGLDVKGNRTGARARHYTGTFFLRRGGKLFLMQRAGQNRGGGGVAWGGKVRALFILVRSVRMVQRKWMGFSDEDLAWAAEYLGKSITTGDSK